MFCTMGAVSGVVVLAIVDVPSFIFEMSEGRDSGALVAVGTTKDDDSSVDAVVPVAPTLVADILPFMFMRLDE